MPSFTYSSRVSWVDTDALAVVHFSNYFRYFERAEQEFYMQTGRKQEDVMKQLGLAFPRVEAHCTYESPLRFGDSVETELSLDNIADKSVRFSFEIRNVSTGKRSAKGSMTLVCVNTETWKGTQIPSQVRELFQQLA